MKTLKLLAVAAIVALAACKQKEENKEQTTDSQSEAQRTQKKHAAGAFKEYIELKDALVKSDAGEAKKEAKELESELSKLSEVHAADAGTVKQHAAHIAATENLKEQREAFAALSESFINLAKNGALGKQEYYIQHCPMALNDKGADWISDEEQIRNPYFGDEMLACGEVKEAVK